MLERGPNRGISTPPTVSIPETLPGLTGLRGLAATVVMAAHLGIGNIHPFQILLWHNSAVDLFFVISCFTLFHVYERNGRSIRWVQYGARRVARIYPLYLVVFAVMAIHNFGFYAADRRFLWRDFIRQFFLVNCWPFIGDNVTWVVPSWSVSVEWLAYFLIFPALFLFHAAFGRRFTHWPSAAFCLSIAASVCAFFVYTRLFDWNDLAIHFTKLPRARQLAPSERVALGFLSGYLLFLCDRRLRRRRADAADSGLVIRLLAIVAVLASFAILLLGAAHRIPIDLMIIMSPALVLCAALSNNLISRAMDLPLFQRLGDLSYALYLVHYPVLILTEEAFMYALSVPPEWIYARMYFFTPLMIALSFGCAVAVHHAVELPCGRMIRGWAGRLARTPTRIA